MADPLLILLVVISPKLLTVSARDQTATEGFARVSYVFLMDVPGPDVPTEGVPCHHSVYHLAVLVGHTVALLFLFYLVAC